MNREIIMKEIEDFRKKLNIEAETDIKSREAMEMSIAMDKLIAQYIDIEECSTINHEDALFL